MSETIARMLLLVAGLYGATGIVTAALFHAFGLTRVDSAARGAGVRFRALITPGLIALWPLVLANWRRTTGARGARS